MKIHSLDTGDTTDIFYTSEYIINVESHLSYLSKSILKTISVTKQQTYKYEGDFYGLLAELNVPRNYHYVVLRVNGLTSSSHYKGINEIVLLPDFNIIDTIISIMETKKD